MYAKRDFENGYPPRLYRAPEEIRRDIYDISRRISEANRMMNVRSLISEIILSGSEGDLPRQIDAVTELVEAAEEMVTEMRELEEGLDMLADELSEAIRASY